MKGKPTPDQHRALVLLAANPRGLPEGFLLAHVVTIDDMIALVQAGLAAARGERVKPATECWRCVASPHDALDESSVQIIIHRFNLSNVAQGQHQVASSGKGVRSTKVR